MQESKATINVDGIEYIRKDLAPVDNRPVTERIKTYEDAYCALGSPAFISLDDTFQDDRAKSIIAYSKLLVIAEALNEGWKPDWTNSSEYKYYPWFKKNTSGSGLSCFGYASWCARSFVPARLCFKSSELAEYAGKQFIDLYSEYML